MKERSGKPRAATAQLTGVLSRWKCASLILSPWLPWGLDRPKSRSLRNGLSHVSYYSCRSKCTSFSSQGLDLLFLVPKGKCNVLVAVSIADTGNTVFTPAVGARAGVIVGEVWVARSTASAYLIPRTMPCPQRVAYKGRGKRTAPSVAVGAIVLSYCCLKKVSMMVVGHAGRRRGVAVRFRCYSSSPHRAGTALTGCPLSLCEVGSPFLPVLGPVTVFTQAPLLLGEELVLI